MDRRRARWVESTRGDPGDALVSTVWTEASWFAHNLARVFGAPKICKGARIW